MAIEFYRESEIPYGVLSNFYMCNIEYKGKIFPTSEHLYQCRKFLYKTASKRSLEYAEIIRKASTPYKAKILGHQEISENTTYQWRIELNKIIYIYIYKDIPRRPLWEEKKKVHMLSILCLKFNQHQNLLNILVETGDKEIREINPYDKYWSYCNGKGKNKLGKILMKIRNYVILNS